MTGAEPAPAPAFTHSVDVRYGECDQQGVVFNAHYLAYIDTAMDHWMRSLDGLGWVDSWDVMLKKSVITWHSPARWAELISIDCSVSRWGTTSFDVTYVLSVRDRAVADAVVTYISVAQGSVSPTPIPEGVRRALDAPLAPGR